MRGFRTRNFRAAASLDNGVQECDGTVGGLENVGELQVVHQCGRVCVRVMSKRFAGAATDHGVESIVEDGRQDQMDGKLQNCQAAD